MESKDKEVLVKIEWTRRNGQKALTKFKPSTAARFLIVLAAAGYDYKIVL